MPADGYTCKLEWKGGTRRERTNGHQPGGMAGHAGRLDPGPGNQRQVIDALKQRVDWKPATIKTLLRRLVKKGALKTTQEGRAFIYTPLIPEQNTMDQAVDQLFDAMCQMRAGKTIRHLVERSTMSVADLQELQAILAEKIKTAPDAVPCDCVPGMIDAECCTVQENGRA